MLCKAQNVQKLCLNAGFLPVLFLSMTAIAWAPTARGQASGSEQPDGTICGTVLLKANHRPASQVAVRLKSHAAGIFRSVLTDFAGHFEVRNLPASTYDIVVEEPGYEPAQMTTEFDGSRSNLELQLKPSTPAQGGRNKYTVSARELMIPGKARGEFEKGLKSLAKKELSESLSHFMKAAQAFPDYYEAYYHAGIVETSMGKLEEASQAFQKAIDLSGGRYAWGEFGIGYVLYAEGKAEEAVSVIRRGLDLDENSPDGYFILGMALLRLDRLDEAEKSGREALLRNPNFARAHLLLADTYARKREYYTQLQSLDAYLKLEPNGAESEAVRKARETVLGILAKIPSEH
jgi:tetratricopeptide (TPR) repeat protein